jgi:hypothetical protein
VSTEDELLAVLRAISIAEQRGQPLDNETLAATLQWDLERVAAVLGSAKQRSLIWGARGGHKPGPWFADLEVTVQGKRLIRGNG